VIEGHIANYQYLASYNDVTNGRLLRKGMHNVGEGLLRESDRRNRLIQTWSVEESRVKSMFPAFLGCKTDRAGTRDVTITSSIVVIVRPIQTFSMINRPGWIPFDHYNR